MTTYLISAGSSTSSSSSSSSSTSSAETIFRWGGNINQLLIAQSLSINARAKKY